MGVPRQVKFRKVSEGSQLFHAVAIEAESMRTASLNCSA
jgi:hypothetical protein